MRRSVIILLLCCWWLGFVHGQTNNTDSLSYPGFSLLRASEDYRFLEPYRNAESGLWTKLKYIPLGDRSYLSVGGDWRTEFQVLRNEVWTEGENDSPLFVRFMLHTDWHVGERLRIFAQLKSGHAIGRNGPPFFLNVDRLDWHQLFAAVKTGDYGKLEIGRRELTYGSRRLISMREGTNIRQSFDGVRYIWQKKEYRLDLLAYAYNPQEIGVFDNRIRSSQLIWGAYYVRQPGETKTGLDLYYLGSRNESPRFEAGTEEEVRHSFGVRHWGKRGALRYNNEAVLQLGEQTGRQIRAWTVSTELYYELGGRLNLTPGMKVDIISGDQDPNDDRLQTFNALYPRGGYFGLLAIIGPANLIDVHPCLGLEPFPGWALNFDWDVFWRHQTGDGIYFPSGRLNLEGSSSEARFIGHQLGMQVGTSINRFFEVEMSYFYFFAGEFLDDITDGANFSQLGFSLNYKF